MSYHQRRSIRLRGYNYCSSGIYFITIRTSGIHSIFGHIQNRKVILNKFGKIAFDDWNNISQIRTNVELDTFIIMPDHIHGIIKFLPAVGATDPVAHNNKDGNINRKKQQFFNKSDDPLSHKKFSLNFQKSLKSNSLSSIIGQYKSVVSKKNHKMGLLEFRWQRSFYDRIIRTKSGLIAIRKYILENPSHYTK